MKNEDFAKKWSDIRECTSSKEFWIRFSKKAIISWKLGLGLRHPWEWWNTSRIFIVLEKCWFFTEAPKFEGPQTLLYKRLLYKMQKYKKSFDVLFKMVFWTIFASFDDESQALPNKITIIEIQYVYQKDSLSFDAMRSSWIWYYVLQYDPFKANMLLFWYSGKL